MITRERAEEIRRAIWKAHGWGRVGEHYTAEERVEIKKYWETLPGTTTFYGAVERMARGDHER